MKTAEQNNTEQTPTTGLQKILRGIGNVTAKLLGFFAPNLANRKNIVGKMAVRSPRRSEVDHEKGLDNIDTELAEARYMGKDGMIRGFDARECGLVAAGDFGSLDQDTKAYLKSRGLSADSEAIRRAALKRFIAIADVIEQRQWLEAYGSNFGGDELLIKAMGNGYFCKDTLVDKTAIADFENQLASGGIKGPIDIQTVTANAVINHWDESHISRLHEKSLANVLAILNAAAQMNMGDTADARELRAKAKEALAKISRLANKMMASGGKRSFALWSLNVLQRGGIVVAGTDSKLRPASDKTNAMSLRLPTDDERHETMFERKAR